MTNPEATSLLLSDSQIKAWWESTSPALSRLTKWMDEREDWVAEPDDEFLSMLEMVVDRVEEPLFVEAMEGELAGHFGQLFALLCSSRFLRLLEMFERRATGIASRLVFALSRLGGGAEVYGDLLCERLMVVHRTELLSEVFSQRRVTAILNAVRLVNGSSKDVG
tara:strand:+ start:85 stop:579 length:495 start_codon:yes stop_codon:yes gene_type:complete